MKKLFKVCTLILSLVFALSFFTLAACGETGSGSGDNGGEETPPPHEHTFASTWSSDADNHWYAATCGHDTEKKDLAPHEFVGNKCSVCNYEKAFVKTASCDVYCPICGKCIDIYCTDDTEKCGDGLTVHKFEAEHATELIKGENENWGALEIKYQTEFEDSTYGKGKEFGDDVNEYAISSFYGSGGNAAVFRFTVSKATTVTFRVRVGADASKKQTPFTNDYNYLLVNDEFVTSTSYTKSNNKWSFAKLIIGCITLKEGENEIQIIGPSMDTSKGFSALDYFELLAPSDVTITWTPNTQRVTEYNASHGIA